ncbi:MAG: thioredoxin family protein [Euryarchaeota archaeon]|nr:thioredoxin family protein [Euryarchaeota archaeon]
MTQQFLDYLSELLQVLILGLLFVYGVYSARRYLRRHRPPRSMLLLVLLAGCLGSQQAGGPSPPVPGSTPASDSGAPSFPGTPEGLRAALSSGYPVVVTFNASWCPSCRRQAPIMEELERAHPGVVFLAIDTDQYPALADGYGVVYLPTIMIFDSEGQVVESFIGLTGKEKLEMVLGSL